MTLKYLQLHLAKVQLQMGIRKDEREVNFGQSKFPLKLDFEFDP